MPSNLALAVGPDIQYAIVAQDDHYVVLGLDALPKYAPQLGEVEPVAVVSGSELVGRTYAPLFPYFADRDDAFRVLEAEFVDTSEGTGVVHMAPGFGEDDQTVCEANGIAIGKAVPVNDQGRFTSDVPEWAGQNVFEANPGIIKHLKDTGRVLRHDTYEHNYPHCWRTDTPIIYKAISSWYVEVTAIRDRLLELNQEINWVPDHVRDGRFGMWLDGARDWSISRNRFWGSPIPVWRSDDPQYPRVDAYGSLDEIEADFGVRPTDLHRPFIDELTRPNPDDPTGKSTMRRVDEVLDCWFESGSMPYAQVHYPFENKDWFDNHYPADFIVEYINQTRGWFYTLHVLAGAIFDRPAFSNVICHGILLADDGAKLSKRLRNYTEPEEIFQKQGADALRWYLMSTNIVRGGDTRISDQGIDDVVRQVITPIWNAFSFFTLYANADNAEATFRTDAQGLLDRYILAKTQELVVSVTQRMDAYDLPGATTEIQQFIDALNNWYIRRSRDRFWAPAATADPDDKRDAYDTLYTVLCTLSQVTAPFLPMVMEEIYVGLTGDKSVHLTDWPEADTFPEDAALVRAMDRTRDVVSTALRLREDQGLRVRLPLPNLTIAGRDTAELASLKHLVTDEVNVKEVSFSEDLAAHASFVLRPDGKVLGPRLGGAVQEVFGAAKRGEWTQRDDGTVVVGEHELGEGEFELALQAPEGVAAGALPGNDAVVVLDVETTPELEAEGIARDVVRMIQEARKTEALVITDRISVWLEVNETVAEAVRTHQGYVADQVLADSIAFAGAPSQLTTHEATVDGVTAGVRLQAV